MDEMQAHGEAGPICVKGIAAIVPNGTKVRWVGTPPGMAKLETIEILDRPHAGTRGVVPASCFHRGSH